MDRQIRRLGAGLLVLFLALFAQVNYIQVIRADDLANNPGNGKRLLIAEYDVQRGAILARDKRTVLARSRPTEGEFRFLRVYPHGPRYGQITGFYSIASGRSDLELTFNDYLSGRAGELAPQRLVDEILGRPKRGGTVVTTIDARLQEAAEQALGNRRGAVAAIDPRTGEVLALVSNPSFDPNPLATHDIDAARQAYLDLEGQSPTPLRSNAYQQLFFPGSTFKLVTAAAALENGIRPDTSFPNPPTLDLPQTDRTLQNFGGGHCLGGVARITLAQAFQISCNVTFAEIGLQLGADRLLAQAVAFGWNGSLPFDAEFSEGLFPPESVGPDRLPAVAFSAIGQQDVRANPMQMALVAGSIANGGVMMRPRLVREILDPSGRVIRSFGPDEIGRPVSPQTAAELTAMMVSVVEGGTGSAAAIPGVRVAGKTGTAQAAEGQAPHAWFVSFAPADSPQIAVAVVVLDGGDLGSEATGGAVAAPIAKQVIEAALGGGA